MASLKGHRLWPDGGEGRLAVTILLSCKRLLCRPPSVPKKNDDEYDKECCSAHSTSDNGWEIVRRGPVTELEDTVMRFKGAYIVCELFESMIVADEPGGILENLYQHSLLGVLGHNERVCT